MTTASIGSRSIQDIRSDFPILDQEVNGHRLVYLDNAATSQKPLPVLKALENYYRLDNSNVHRGIHALSNRATEAYENARKRAAQFLNAPSAHEIIFTRGTTEGINLVASSWGADNLHRGDVILLTEMEHHSNIVPWQLIAKRTGAVLKYVPVVGDEGLLEMSQFDQALAQGNVKIFACTHISNTLGTVNPVREICAKARAAGAVSLIDAAQSAGHRPVDVQEIGCDFLALSGHKACAPTGTGILFGREQILEQMSPYQGGGDMISRVDFFESRWNTLPYKFEAGTPHIAGAIGLQAALEYIEGIGRVEIAEHDATLARYAYKRLKEMEGVRVLGPDPEKGRERAGVVSFVLPGVHAHDVVTLADRDGVALRGGHHCNQPLMRKLGTPATARASFYLYNTTEEVDRFVEVLQGIVAFFRR
jgi:cysteine desulfurase/selenocysteine lyase